VERAIEVFAGVNFLIIGVSHLAQPHAWVDFFIWLRSKGHTGVFVNGFLSLTFGSIIVAFHNVWSGWPMVLTIMGWGQVLKAFLSFVFPQIGLRTMERVSHARAREFMIPGALFAVLGGWLVYVGFTR
jgi:hypothetical protein